MSDEEFTAYVRANNERWLGFARKCFGQHAEDVLQTAILKLWTHRAGIDPARVDALFLTVLRREAVSRWRGQDRPLPAETPVRPDYDPRTPETAALENETAEVLRGRMTRARALLTPRERSALAVWLLERPTREQAASWLGTTRGGYSAAVNDALEKLNRSLGIDPGLFQQVMQDLGHQRALAVLTDVFQGDLPPTN